ncbi:uncharacterized protein LOC141691294 [Apium graveolens]|uniref:uncharacterized protein LOC141691294 n=1 Tax=Apium graveolens TaxID=4045 RepID=UPI003D7AE91F
MFAVDCQGQGGGLAFLWRNKDEAALSFSINHIDMVITVHGWKQFRLTGLYGEPDRLKRRSTWDLIRNISSTNSIPWCVVGDMNNILHQSEKKGGRRYPSWLLQGFREVLDDCNLMDMEMQEYRYTWERGRGTNDWIKIRLDRALVSRTWLDTFQNAKLSNLEVTISDHTPILLEPDIPKQRVNSKRFKFENAWLRDPMCKNIAAESWERHKNQTLQVKIKETAYMLVDRGNEITGSFRRKSHKARRLSGQ